MIGTFIRSTHHLTASGEYLKPLKIIGIRHNHAIMGDIVKVKDKNGRDIFFYFQNANCNVDLKKALQYCDNESAPIITQMFEKRRGRCVLFTHLDELRSYGTQFILLPDNFDELYDTFTQQNRKVVDPIFGKYFYKEDDISKLLFALCESANFFVWAAKNVRGNRIALMTIYRIMTWKNNYSQLVGKLNKGTITAYNTTFGVLDLLRECQELRKTKRANDIINLFNTEQKKLLKSNFDKLSIETLSKFAILSKTKQQNFVRKVSTITDLDEIMRLMAFTTSDHFKWDKQSLLDYLENVEGLKCKVVLTNDTSVLVEVEDFETVKKLAKTTNWCISKNKSYWNNYMGKRDNSLQYIIFDFSKKEDDELSIVGFTTTPNKGITHAHSFTNADLMRGSSFDNDERPYANLLRSENVRQGIYAVIADNKIPLSLVTKFKSRFPIWTKEAFLEVLNKYISQEDYTIYFDDNDKLVISTKSVDGIFSLFGDTYVQKFSDCYRNCEHIFFLDFSKDSKDDEKLKFTIVTSSNYNSSYKSTLPIYNEYSIQSKDKFNNLLANLNMPYNIICRPDTVKHRFLEAITNHDLKEMETYIDDAQIKSLLLQKSNNEVKMFLKNELYSSISSYLSIELLDMVERHGYTIENFFNYQEVRNLIRQFFGDAIHCGGANYYQDETKFDAEKLYSDLVNNTLSGVNTHQKAYIVRCYLFNRIIKPYEDNIKALKVILHDIVNSLSDYHYGGYITNYLIVLALKYIDMNAVSSELINIFNVVLGHNIKRIIDILLKTEITNEDVRKTLLSYAPSKIQKEFKRAWGIKEEPKKPKEEVLTTKIDAANTFFASNIGTYTYTWADPWGTTASTF